MILGVRFDDELQSRVFTLRRGEIVVSNIQITTTVENNSVTINAHVNSLSRVGRIAFFVDNTLVTTEDWDDNDVQYTVTGLSNGTHSAYCTFYGDDVVSSSIREFSMGNGSLLTINVPLSLIYSDAFNITGTLTDSNNNPLANQTVKLYVGSSTVDTTTTDTNGEYSFTHTPVRTGNHTFKVVFDGVTGYAGSESSTVARVVGVETSVLNITTPINNTHYYTTDNVVVSGALCSDDGETISGATINVIKNNNTLGTTTTSNDGSFTITLQPVNVGVGDSTLIISYDGDDNYASSTATRTININSHEYTLSMSATEDTVGSNSTINSSVITGVLRDRGVVVANETVTITVKDENDTTIVSTTDTTDSNGEVSYTYTANARGNISILMECMNLQETYVLEDVNYYFPNTYNNGVQQLTSHISTNFKAEYKIKITQTSNHGHYFQVGTSNGAMLIGTTSPSSNKTSIFAWNMSGSSENMPGSLQLDTWYTVEISYVDGVWSASIDGNSITLSQTYTTRDYVGVRPEQYGFVKEIKITEL